MAANLEKTEGIVLSSIEFRDRQRLIKVFTPHFGLMTLIVKGISKKAYHLISLTSLLTRGEFLFSKGRGEIFRFIEGTTLDMHLPLREDLCNLNVAGKLVHTILRSQFPGKPSPRLYALFVSYLTQLPSFIEKETILYSFYLKMLKHEGLLPSSSLFDPKDWKIVDILLSTRTFAAIRNISISDVLKKRIEEVFNHFIF